MWWWTYVYHIKACDRINISVMDHETELVPDATEPLSFKWSDSIPVISAQFEDWRDSLISGLQQDQILHITGIAFRDESDEDPSLLAYGRARAIEQLFAVRMPAENIHRDAQVGTLNADLRKKHLVAFRLRPLIRNTAIWEMPGCTMLHFPYDSTTQSIDGRIDHYLQHLVNTIDTSVTWIKLRTIVDDQRESARGTVMSWRMQALRERMIIQGIPEKRVLINTRDTGVPVECVPDGFEDETQDWIALIFTK